MARIIEPAHRVLTERKVRLFEFLENRSCSFQFDVVDGELVFCCEDAKRNFRYCLEHPEEYKDKGNIIVKNSYWQDARAICECGREIFLRDTYLGAGECRYCGRWHNLFGEELLPPEQWEEQI